MKQSMSGISCKLFITWWQDCPPGSGSVPNYSNSSKQGQIKKNKMYANRMLNSKGSYAGNDLYHANFTHKANLPYYPLLSSRNVTTYMHQLT